MEGATARSLFLGWRMPLCIPNYYACPQERRDRQQIGNRCRSNQFDTVSELSAGLWRRIGNERVCQFVNMKSLNVPRKTFY